MEDDDVMKDDELAAALGELRKALREAFGPLIGGMERWLTWLSRRVERMGD